MLDDVTGGPLDADVSVTYYYGHNQVLHYEVNGKLSLMAEGLRALLERVHESLKEVEQE